MKSKFYLLLFLIILPLLVPVSSQVDDNEIVILFDEAHNQFFDRDMMQTALGSLEGALNVTIRVEVNNAPFNSSSLQGADLLIVTNPGLKSDGTPLSVSSSEKDSIASFVEQGNSVFYMGNPYSHDVNISGHAKALNNLIIDEFEAKMNVVGVDSDNVTVILDDFNNDGNASHVLIDAGNVGGEVLTTEINNLTDAKFLLYSGFVSSTNFDPAYYGNTSYTAYKVDQNFEIAVDNIVDNAKWMEALDGKGRVMLVGSTIMFSDYVHDGTSSWVEKESNLELFQNLVAWLLKITPLEKENIIDQEFTFFAKYNLFIALGITVFLSVIWFGSLIYRKQITFDRIFAIKISKKSTRKKQKQKPSAVKTGKTKKLKQKRKRN